MKGLLYPPRIDYMRDGDGDEVKIEIENPCPECGEELTLDPGIPMSPHEEPGIPAAAWCDECGFERPLTEEEAVRVFGGGEEVRP